MTRAAIYARYSSDLQSAASIEDQIRECRARADQLGHEVVATYSDAAISGAFLMNRPAINDMIRDARAGKFQIVIAEALDRISRNLGDVAKLHEQLTYAGVRIVTIAEGEVTDLHVGLKGTMNALFLKDMAAKVKRGQKGRTEAGKATCGLAYGYRAIRRLTPEGTVIGGEREIVPEQAAIIVEIYQRFAGGESPRTIAHDLNARGVPGPRGGVWNTSTINGSAKRLNGILHNEIYAGRLIYNRQSFRKDPNTGRRIPRINPPEQWTVVEVPELRIVSEELWKRAQRARREISRAPLNVRMRPKHLLSGLLRCGVCGGPIIKVTNRHLGCSRQKEQGTCTNRRRIAQDRLEEEIIGGLRDHMLAPDKVARFVRDYRAAVQEQNRSSAQRHAELAKRIDRLSVQIKSIVRAIAEGLDTKEMRAEMMRMSREQEDLEGQLQRLQEPSIVTLHPEAADLFRDQLAEIQDALREEETRPEAVRLLRRLIAEVTITPVEGERGVVRANLTGRLAGLMSDVELAEEFRFVVGGQVVAPGRYHLQHHEATVSFLVRSRYGKPKRNQ